MLREKGAELLKPYGAGLSVGLASLHETESSYDLYKRADRHMYGEKKK